MFVLKSVCARRGRVPNKLDSNQFCLNLIRRRSGHANRVCLGRVRSHNRRNYLREMGDGPRLLSSTPSALGDRRPCHRTIDPANTLCPIDSKEHALTARCNCPDGFLSDGALGHQFVGWAAGFADAHVFERRHVGISQSLMPTLQTRAVAVLAALRLFRVPEGVQGRRRVRAG